MLLPSSSSGTESTGLLSPHGAPPLGLVHIPSPLQHTAPFFALFASFNYKTSTLIVQAPFLPVTSTNEPQGTNCNDSSLSRSYILLSFLPHCTHGARPLFIFTARINQCTDGWPVILLALFTSCRCSTTLRAKGSSLPPSQCPLQLVFLSALWRDHYM